MLVSSGELRLKLMASKSSNKTEKKVVILDDKPPSPTRVENDSQQTLSGISNMTEDTFARDSHLSL